MLTLSWCIALLSHVQDTGSTSTRIFWLFREQLVKYLKNLTRPNEINLVLFSSDFSEGVIAKQTQQIISYIFCSVQIPTHTNLIPSRKIME